MLCNPASSRSISLSVSQMLFWSSIFVLFMRLTLCSRKHNVLICSFVHLFIEFLTYTHYIGMDGIAHTIELVASYLSIYLSVVCLFACIFISSVFELVLLIVVFMGIVSLVYRRSVFVVEFWLAVILPIGIQSHYISLPNGRSYADMDCIRMCIAVCVCTQVRTHSIESNQIEPRALTINSKFHWDDTRNSMLFHFIDQM